MVMWIVYFRKAKIGLVNAELVVIKLFAGNYARDLMIRQTGIS